jgi:hypothetical protein
MKSYNNFLFYLLITFLSAIICILVFVILYGEQQILLLEGQNETLKLKIQDLIVEHKKLEEKVVELNKCTCDPSRPTYFISALTGANIGLLLHKFL